MKSVAIETILFQVLLIRDFDILGLGGSGENLMLSAERRVLICISVLKIKQHKNFEIFVDYFKNVSLI